jgi:hypothetical protein
MVLDSNYHSSIIMSHFQAMYGYSSPNTEMALSWWSQRRSRVRRGAETTAINQEWGELIGFNFY